MIPAALEHLPRYGELPIPWTTPIIGGRPSFRAVEPGRHNMAVRFRLCGICGRHIAAPPYAFMVGPFCFFERSVFGAPNHPECARYATQLCPHLARRDHARHEPPDAAREAGLALGTAELPGKPERIGIALAPSFGYQKNGPLRGVAYVSLPRGSFDVEWYSYRDGRLELEAAPPEEP